MSRIIPLIKKDIYLNYKSLLPSGAVILIFLFYKIISINSFFHVVENFILLFTIGMASSYFIPFALFDVENKNDGLKVLKSLAYGNKEIYFSKLILTYLLITLYIFVPLIYLLVFAKSFITIKTAYLLLFFVSCLFFFFSLSAFFVFFFACFNKVLLNAILNIFFFVLVALAIKFKDKLSAINYDFIIDILRVIFFLQPIILIFVIFLGYKLFDKVFIYKKLN